MQPVAELVNQNENVSLASTMGRLLTPIEGAYCHSCVALRTNRVSNACSKVWLGWSRATGVRLSIEFTYTLILVHLQLPYRSLFVIVA